MFRTGCKRLLSVALLSVGLLLAVPARPAQSATCSGFVVLEYVSGVFPATIGETIRVRLSLFGGAITGGTNNVLQVDRARFALDCSVDFALGLPCTDDGSVIAYQGNLTSTNCFDAVGHPQTFFANSVAGDLTPNEVVFNPDLTVTIPHDSTQANACVLEFDVQIASLSNDSTPNIVEEVGGLRSVSGVPDAHCDNGLSMSAFTSSQFALSTADTPTPGPTNTRTPTPTPTPTLTPTFTSTPLLTCGNGIVNSGEQCDGGACCSPTCLFDSSNTVCQAPAGTCDVAEFCTGSNAACPINAVAPAFVDCRPAAGVCDVDEFCSGTSAACPPDTFSVSSVACDDGSVCTQADHCDGSGHCIGSPVAQGTACDADGKVCTVDVCDGHGFCGLDHRVSCEGPFGDPSCSDGVDNDSDSLIDAQDPDCRPPVEGPPGDPSCSDGLDNDGNGLVDAADPNCQTPNTQERCNGVDDNGNGLVDEGFPDSDGDGIADCVDQDQDNDGVLDGADNCPTVFNPDQKDTNGNGVGDACDGAGNPITNPPSAHEIVIDGQFEPPAGEWGDVTPVDFLGGLSKVYTSLDPGHDAIYLMYDFSLSTTPLTLGQEAGPVRFQVGGSSFFDVFIVQGGANTSLGPHPATSQGGAGDSVRVLLNGLPFDNSAGCIQGAVDFNTTSPNFPGIGHNLAELEVHLTGSPGGCYSPEPAFWSATLPGVLPLNAGLHTSGLAAGGEQSFLVSQSFVHIGNDGSTTVTPAAQTTDHFQCHGAHIKKGTPRFQAVNGVTLVDQFGALTVNVRRPIRLCAPADKNGEDLTAPFHPDHLIGYSLSRPRGAPKFVKRTNQKVVNQFGTLFVDVIRPVRLLVPSAKSLSSAPPAPSNPAVDHFDCYSVRVTKGMPKFATIKGVAVEDQFGPLTVNVTRPTQLCAPANKRNENPGAETHVDHLMCYAITVPRGTPRFTKITPVFATDQFAQETLDVTTRGQLCVPSLKNPTP